MGVCLVYPTRTRLQPPPASVGLILSTGLGGKPPALRLLSLRLILKQAYGFGMAHTQVVAMTLSVFYSSFLTP